MIFLLTGRDSDFDIPIISRLQSSIFYGLPSNNYCIVCSSKSPGQNCKMYLCLICFIVNFLMIPRICDFVMIYYEKSIIMLVSVSCSCLGGTPSLVWSNKFFGILGKFTVISPSQCHYLSYLLICKINDYLPEKLTLFCREIKALSENVPLTLSYLNIGSFSSFLPKLLTFGDSS